VYNYYLRANSRLEIEIALKNAGFLEPVDFGDGKIFYIQKNEIKISHIGSIIVEEPIVDENLVLIKDTIFDNRWHTNIKTKHELTEEQKQILPIIDPPPKTPKVIF
jgi:hypothetical protein